MELHLPPLRERLEDIPLLIHSYIKKSNSPVHFSEKTIKRLSEGNYPGNIRQLFNLLERIVTLAETDEIQPEDLDGIIPDKENFFMNSGNIEQKNMTENEKTSALNRTIQNSEQKQIEECLRSNNGNRGKTAADLNISTTTLWRKIKKYRINLY